MTFCVERVKEIEAEIRSIMGNRPDEFFHEKGCQKPLINRLKDLAWKRKEILNSLYLETTETKERLRLIANIIYGLKRKMLKRMLTLYRLNIVENPEPAFDKDYELMGRVEVGVYYDPDDSTEVNDTVLTLPDDNYYGSNFRYMLPAIREIKCKGVSIIDGIAITNIYLKNVNIDHAPTVDEIFGRHYCELDDEKSWTEKEAELKEKMQYIKTPLSEFDQWPLSIPDILRINSFDIQIELWLQHYHDINE